MTRGLEPTEEYDGAVTVALMDDDGTRERIRCRSFEEAIETVKAERSAAAVVEIVGKDGEVVFDSVDMDIEDWEVEWRHAMRRLSVDVEDRECPHGNVACFADDRCIECQMDRMRERPGSDAP